MTFNDLLKDLGEIAPFHLAQPWDRVGAMTGRGSQEIRRVLVSLDPSPEALAFAIESDCQAWLTHHPIIWDPLKSLATLSDSSPSSQVLLKLLLRCVEAGMAVASCHTNWDAADGGVNDALAGALGLTVTERFGDGVIEERLKVAVTLPADHLNSVVQAASGAGAGAIGLYSRCSFSWPGRGTFLPLDGSNPTLGEVGSLETTEEVRVEMALPARLKDAVDAAVRRAHPYEEPAIDWLVCDSETVGRLGVIAKYPKPTSVQDLADSIAQKLTTAVRVYGSPQEPIQSAALVGGAGSGFWRQAVSRAQVLITGEVRQNDALEASASGFCLVEAGHYATEQPGMSAMVDALRARGWDSRLFVPQPGQSGRPFDSSLA